MSEVGDVWKRIAGSLVEVEIAGQSAWMLNVRLAQLDEFSYHSLVVRLLADFDTYLLGYQSRDMVVATQYAKRINAGGGMIRPTLLVNGRTVGTWKSTRRKKQLDIVVEPFEQLSPAIQPGLEAEAADIARFLGIPAAVVTVLN